MTELLYGRNAVRESLRANRRPVHRLFLSDNLQPAEIIDEIVGLARQRRIPVRQVSRRELERQGRSHQGLALEVGAYPTVDLQDVLDHAAEQDEEPFIVVMDHVEDPHNLGAVLRTAEIVGVHGVVIPKQRAAGITPTVVNVSAGAAEHMRVAEIPNVVQLLKLLKQKAVWVAGVEHSPTATPYHQANLSGAIALVIGSEGPGLARLVRETCDFMVRLPMRGQIEFLNASVAAALILYEVWRVREFA